MKDFLNRPKKLKRFSIEEDKVWQEHEKDTEDVVSGKRTPGSGSKAHSKGDVRSSEYLVECKSTERLSMSFKLAWLEKITSEAADAGKIPLVSVRFDQAVVASKDWVMIPVDFFEELTDN